MSDLSFQNLTSDIDALTYEKRAFVNGGFVDFEHNETITKVSSIDGRDLSGIAAAQAADIHHAVQCARQSQIAWRHKPVSARREILSKLADLMTEHRRELALLDTLETGRSFKNYYYDSIPKSIEALRWFIESVDKCFDHAVSPHSQAFATVTREPLGVVGLITPWNDPLVVAMWKLAPALLMGNAVVIKPAEQSSLSILKVAELATQAGLPAGVLNVLPGYGDTAGKSLALHHDVDGVFFTGSSEVGKLILQYSGQSNMKKVGLECGGKSAFVVSEHCQDLQAAAETLAKNMFYNQGQICSAPSRAIIASPIKTKFLEYLKQAALAYYPRDPLDIASEVGCVVSPAQKERIESYIQKGLAEGAVIVNEREAYAEQPACSVTPVIFDAVAPQSTVAQEEIFGPVLTVIEASNLTEAIALANQTHYGLAASIWTDHFHEAHQAAQELQAGIVHINSYGEDDNTVPFGGIKQSGIGKDKSVYAFDEYSYTKTTWAAMKPLSTL